MKRSLLSVVVGLGFLIGTGLGATARDTMSLKDAVSNVVDREMGTDGEGADPTMDGLEPDTTGVESGMLDDILLTPEPYYYESLGRRDPFKSLVADKSEEDEDRLSKDSITVVGILWGDNDKVALTVLADGTSMILREGDRVRNASVTSIRRDGIVLYIDNYGIGRTITIPLTEGKGAGNGRGRER